MCTASEDRMDIQANLSLCLTHMMYLWFYHDQTLLKIESLLLLICQISLFKSFWVNWC